MKLSLSMIIVVNTRDQHEITCCPTFCASTTHPTVYLIQKKNNQKHWLHYDNTILLFNSIESTSILFYLIAGLPVVRPARLGEWLQIFHTTKVITSDLQNCCSD